MAQAPHIIPPIGNILPRYTPYPSPTTQHAPVAPIAPPAPVNPYYRNRENEFQWLQSVHSSVGSFGVFTELLRLNAESMIHVSGSIYGMLAKLVDFFTSDDLSKLYPNHQSMTEEETLVAKKKLKFVKYVLGFLLAVFGGWLIKKLLFGNGQAMITQGTNNNIWSGRTMN
eukprot:TRINITY_DN780210_c0_g1_i1.p1 TRINITY_DN780210_c0_g1~~TRINITY_DN780210_c0_g1_i1.p1  ORF type:complete len:170 (+),score=36.55 TRINITY_DN780210_c0_g1_i1:273-782(+)